MKRNIWGICLVLCCEMSIGFSVQTELPEFIKWNQVDFNNLPRPRNSNLAGFPYFIPTNTLPMGLYRHGRKLFVGVPRRGPGIPSTLNVIDLDSFDKLNPKLTGYPSYQTNELHPDLKPDPNRLVNVYRPRADSCNRLFVIDTGRIYFNNTVIRRYEIPESVIEDGSGLVNIAIDVDPNDCADAFLYIPDLVSYRIVVYSFKENRAWSFYHNYFHLSPLHGDFKVGGIKFSWDDGIFSIALGNVNPDGYRDVYFHALSSIYEFVVSSRVLKNETASEREYHGDDFRLFCNRGPRSQSNSHFFDPKTKVMFFNQINKHGVGCWNSRDQCRQNRIDLAYQNNETMIYPSDLSVDQDGFVWFMSNRMPVFMYSKIDWKDFNFRIFRVDASAFVNGTKCQ